MGICSCPCAGSERTINWRGSGGTLGRRPVTQPKSRTEWARTLATIGIHGQGRRFGSSKSNGGRNRSPPYAFERSAEPFGGRSEPLRTDGQRDPKEALTRRAKGAPR